MREVKFRGKRLDNGEWVYGMTISNGTIKRKDRCIYFEVTEGKWVGVDPSTVGQFTGLHDMNGKEIYDGDVIDYVADGAQLGTIIYDNFGGVSIEFGDEKYWQTINLRLLMTMEVVGNIYDNPELIKSNLKNNENKSHIRSRHRGSKTR